MTMTVAPHVDLSARAPRSISPAHWHQSVGYARQACARVFRDGGSPTDAVAVFGIKVEGPLDWSRAVELIAERLCARPVRRVA
ncbi:MAG: hypothetical protein ACK4TL_01055 [Hyphomicrobiaceae bacterium]